MTEFWLYNQLPSICTYSSERLINDEKSYSFKKILFIIFMFRGAIREKNVFGECEVWCKSKARVTTIPAKLMFFPCRTRFFFLIGGQKLCLFSPHGAIKSTLLPAKKKNIQSVMKYTPLLNLLEDRKSVV